MSFEKQLRITLSELIQMSQLEQDRFVNALKILHSIDYYEVSKIMSKEEWPAFRDHPYEFFMRAPDTQRDFIWSVIQSRQPKL